MQPDPQTRWLVPHGPADTLVVRLWFGLDTDRQHSGMLFAFCGIMHEGYA